MLHLAGIPDSSILGFLEACWVPTKSIHPSGCVPVKELAAGVPDLEDLEEVGGGQQRLHVVFGDGDGAGVRELYQRTELSEFQEPQQ